MAENGKRPSAEDIKSYQLREQEIIQAILDSKDKYRKIVQAGIAKWVKDFQEGRVQIQSVDDLKKLIEIDHELLISTKRILSNLEQD